MKSFKRLFRRFFRPDRSPQGRSFALDSELHESLEDLAKRERRPVEEIANDLLEQALGERAVAEGRLQPWWILTPRQQQIAALVCMGYTNREIAARLSISRETVKSHIRAILKQFDIHSKAELRQLLAGWDFSNWH